MLVDAGRAHPMGQARPVLERFSHSIQPLRHSNAYGQLTVYASDAERKLFVEPTANRSSV